MAFHAATEPKAQAVQLVLLTLAVYCPGGQGTHEGMPGTSVYVPAVKVRKGRGAQGSEEAAVGVRVGNPSLSLLDV